MTESPNSTPAASDRAAPDRPQIRGQLRSRLQLAGILIAAGLVLEAITLAWSHPFSFMTFIFLSGALVVGGAGLYLWTIVSHGPGE